MPIPQIFICYAKKDERKLERLLTHLKPLQDEKRVAIWRDQGAIRPGDAFEQEIERAIQGSSVAIVFVTANLMASDFVKRVELPLFFQRRQANLLRIVPVFWSAADTQLEIRFTTFEGASMRGRLADLEGIGSPGKTLAEEKPARREAAFQGLVKSLREWTSVSEEPKAGDLQPISETPVAKRSQEGDQWFTSQVRKMLVTVSLIILVVILVAIGLREFTAGLTAADYLDESGWGFRSWNWKNYESRKSLLWSLERESSLVKRKFVSGLVTRRLESGDLRNFGREIGKSLGGLDLKVRRELASLALEELEAKADLRRYIAESSDYPLLLILRQISPGDPRIEDLILQSARSSPGIQGQFSQLIAEMLENPARGFEGTMAALESEIDNSNYTSVLAGISEGIKILSPRIPEQRVRAAMARVALRSYELDPNASDLPALTAVLEPWAGSGLQEEVAARFGGQIAASFVDDRLKFAESRSKTFLFALRSFSFLTESQKRSAADLAVHLDDESVDELVGSTYFLESNLVGLPSYLRQSLATALIRRIDRKISESDLYWIPRAISRLEVELKSWEGQRVATYLVTTMVDSPDGTYAGQVRLVDEFSQYLTVGQRAHVTEKLIQQVLAASPPTLREFAALRAWNPQLDDTDLLKLYGSLETAFRNSDEPSQIVEDLRMLSTASVFLNEDRMGRLFDTLRQKARDLWLDKSKTELPPEADAEEMMNCTLQILDSASKFSKLREDAPYMTLAQAETALRSEGLTAENLDSLAGAAIVFSRGVDEDRIHQIRRCLLLSTNYSTNQAELGLGLAAVLALSRDLSDQEYASLVVNFLKYPEVDVEIEKFLAASLKKHSPVFSTLSGDSGIEVAYWLGKHQPTVSLDRPPLKPKDLIASSEFPAFLPPSKQ